MMIYSILMLLTLACSVNCNATSSCSEKTNSERYLDIAMENIRNAKDSIQCNTCRRAVDCADLQLMGHDRSGVYEIWPLNRVTEEKSLKVYCDMDTNGGGWTVFQRRGDFQRPKDYFYKDWRSYKEGFGDLLRDFWLGNDNIYALSNQKPYSVRFDLRDVEGNRRYALYDKFWIEDEIEKYRLHISDFSGDAGDSITFTNDNNNLNNQKFSTKDQDNDMQRQQHCAQLYKGGWWYNGCHHANLNGLYLKGRHGSFADGINWYSWKGYYESLEWTEIKIRPKNFRRATTTMTAV